MSRASAVRDFSSRAPTSWTWDSVLLKACDVSLAGVVLVAPLFLGGYPPLGRLVYVILACAAALAFGLRQCLFAEATWRRSGAEWLILAVVVLLLVQLAPLSTATLHRVAPDVVNRMPLWQEGASGPVHFGPWKSISVTPRETRGGLVLFLAHALVFLTLVQRLHQREDVERVLTWMALSAAGMAVLALAQYFFGNGKFLWVYMHPARDTNYAVKGAFFSQNHFAQFLALGLGPLIWLTRRHFEERGADENSRAARAGWKQRAAPILLVAALAAVGFGGLMTYSRGGVAALFVATVVCVGVYVWKRLLGFRSVAGLAVVAVIASLAILAYGYEPLTRRLGTLHESESLDELSHARAKLWRAMLQASANHRLFGSGVGSHMQVYPTYLNENIDNRMTHGENGYLQVLLETGVAGAALLAAGAAVGLFWAGRSVWRGDGTIIACAAPVLGGLLASLTQSLGDFVWYIPACMSSTVVLLACACRLHQLSRPEVEGEADEETRAIPRVLWIGVASLLLSLTAAMVRDRVPPALAAPYWNQYEVLWLRSSGKSVWTTEGETIAPDSPGLTARLMEYLDSALQRDPDNALANLRMAEMCLRTFDIRQQNSENAMPLTQVRDAAVASNFKNREEQDQWLTAAIGPNRECLDRAARCARRSLHLCPLQGDAYVYLANIAFLDGLRDNAKHALIDQAERLRPYSGTVLVAVGQEAAIEGDVPRAMDYCKRAFRQNPESQQCVIEWLAGRINAQQFIDIFEPDLRGLGSIYMRFRFLNYRDDAIYAGERYAAALEAEAERRTGAAAAQLWSVATGVHQYAGKNEQALACSERAVRSAPGDAAARRTYGFQLLEAARYDDAVVQFQWCLRYDADDQPAQSGLNRAMHRGLTSPATANGTTPVQR